MRFTPQRLERVHRAMRNDDVRALVVTRRQDVQYLTGYHNPSDYLPVGCVLVQGKQPYILMSEFQQENTNQEVKMARIRTIDNGSEDGHTQGQGPAFWSSIQRLLEDHGVHSDMIGIQQEYLPIRGFEQLKDVLPDAGFKDISQLLWRLRQVKDNAEIEAIKQAAKIAEIGVRTALEIVVPGVSESSASIEIEAAMRAAGGQLRGIRAAVLSSNNARLPFAEPSARRIGHDDLVIVDITVSESGYFAGVSRSLHTGNPSKEQNLAYESLVKICSIAEDKMSSGIKISDVVGAIIKGLKKKACQSGLIHPIGNSIGLDLQEPPILSATSNSVLREGMVFSVHPTCYIPGVGSARTADVVLISKDGAENITTVARETM
ncbi:MAG: M24 family metallopeptidase [Promethearchaeota archaeon]